MKLALALYQLPAAQKSDDETQKYYHARTLLAASFVCPTEKANHLAEASRRIDSIAPGLKRFKSVVRVRDEIAKKMKKWRLPLGRSQSSVQAITRPPKEAQNLSRRTFPAGLV